MFNIVIGDKNWEQKPGGMVTGEIYFEMDDGCFPEKNWSDYPVLILGWWIYNFVSAKRNNLPDLEFIFMNGGASVSGTMSPDGIYELQFIRQTEANKQVVMKTKIPQNELQETLVNAGRQMMEVIKKESFENTKLEGFELLIGSVDQ